MGAQDASLWRKQLRGEAYLPQPRPELRSGGALGPLPAERLSPALPKKVAEQAPKGSSWATEEFHFTGQCFKQM